METETTGVLDAAMRVAVGSDENGSNWINGTWNRNLLPKKVAVIIGD